MPWLILSVALVLLSQSLAIAQVYRWVDDNGVVHYSQSLEAVPERNREQATSPRLPEITPHRDGPSRAAIKGGPTSRQQRAAAARALRALKTLQSITHAGITYQHYVARVADTQVLVDQSFERTERSHIEALIRAALAYYTGATSVWQASFGRDENHMIGLIDIYSECDHVRALQRNAIQVKVRGVSAMWSCASDLIAATEHTLRSADEAAR